jgi:outer membrane lipoprotein carrier protein
VEFPLKTILSLLLVVFLVPAAQAAEIDAAAAAVAGKEAQFTHRFTPKGFKTSQVESGSVIFGKLPMMRWSYARPEQKLFVFDGNRSWFYVPADRQVTVGELDDRRRAELPFLFLGDRTARDKHFVVSEQRKGNRVVTTLQPRSGAGTIRTVTVTINPQSHLIESVQYADRAGNQTSFAFSGYHPVRTTTETFRFAPPAGVQVVPAE